MAVFRTIDEVTGQLNRPVVAIGNFDGLHRGHQKVFRTLRERAAIHGLDVAILTFEPHPVRYFRSDAPAFRLTTPEQRFALMEEMGIDGVAALPFDEALRSMSPEEFVEIILHKALGASCVMVGEGFVFGKARAGNTDMLRALNAERGIDTEIVEPEIDEAGEVISSTRIRAALARGDLKCVTDLLGRGYSIHGHVVHGDARGRNLGFPTANIRSINPLLPPDGIYATWLYDKELGRVAAATYVGNRPTFETEGRTVEAFVIDADGPIDLYDHPVRLEFVDRVRADRAFDSAEALIEQMHEDVADARQLLGI